VNGAAVYWTTQGGNVRRYNKAAMTLGVVATNQADPEGVAVDTSAVYWVNANSGEVLKRVNGGMQPPKALATGQTKPWAVAVDASYVYWVNNAPDGGVLRAPK
jgi:hypothetical protein